MHIRLLAYKTNPICDNAQRCHKKKERFSIQKSAPKRKITCFDDYDAVFYDKLRALRTEIASEAGIPPYIVFSDKTLKDLSAKKPQSKEAMLEVHGIGEVKFERYGEAFLEILNG